MRPRAVGGLEPDDAEQTELVSLWHLSRILGTSRNHRLGWVVDEYCQEHPDAPRKWVYVWSQRYLGVLVSPDPVFGHNGWTDGRTNASPVPMLGRARKKRAK